MQDDGLNLPPMMMHDLEGIQSACVDRQSCTASMLLTHPQAVACPGIPHAYCLVEAPAHLQSNQQHRWCSTSDAAGRWLTTTWSGQHLTEDCVCLTKPSSLHCMGSDMRTRCDMQAKILSFRNSRDIAAVHFHHAALLTRAILTGVT